MTPETVVDEPKTRSRVTKKDYSGTTVTISVFDDAGELIGEVSRDITTYPSNIQAILPVHGAIQKLGDSAAGCKGLEAFNAIKEMDTQLANGEWTTRKASEGTTLKKKDVNERLAGMSTEDQIKAREMLSSLGMKF